MTVHLFNCQRHSLSLSLSVVVKLERETMSGVLVLNASYEPLNLVNVKRAVVLVLKNKAEIIEERGGLIHSERLDMPFPTVIRLAYYVHVPYRRVFICRRAV